MQINVPPHKSLPLVTVAVHDHANDVIDYAAVVLSPPLHSRDP